MGKYERMQRRKERRRMESDKKRRMHEDKPSNSDKAKKQPSWRRDKNGNWIFKNSIRFSYIGIFVTVLVVGSIAIFGYAVGMIWLTDFCEVTDMIACGFVPEPEPVFVPETERDFAPPEEIP
mgnify:CR=1 FL=1